MAFVSAALGQAVVSVSQPVQQVSPPRTGLEFSANPTTQEIFRARVFEEPLVPIGGEPSATENAAVAGALTGYSQRSGPDVFSSITGFLEKHPQSPWKAALLTDLGLEYYNTAHYSLALDAWGKAWALAKGETLGKGKAIADRAAGELARMYARLGRVQELEALLKSVENRVFVGSATEKISGAREGLWNMKNRPEISFRCGPLALHRIKVATDPTNRTDMIIHESASTQKGFSLPQVAELSKKIGLNYQMAFREERGDLVVPAVVHWKLGHYAALVRQEGDRYLLEDSTFGNTVWATRAALDAETSGYFLIPSGPLPRGWRVVESQEGNGIWGKGNPGLPNPGPHGCGDHNTGGQSCAAPCGGLGGSGAGPAPGLPGPAPGQSPMAVSSVNLMLVNLALSDEPVGYSPPVGPPVRFFVRYSHRDAFQPATFTYANFGPKWTCAWIAYITDNPGSLSADVNYYMRGGGTRTFTGFNTNTQTYSYELYDQTLLRRTGPASYEMLWRDGSRMVFTNSDGSVGTSRKVFLSQIVDPSGNAATLNYDGNLRLTGITDAIGQVTTLTYSTNDIYKVTRVTDPFGRFASFDYDQLGRLTNITDVIGIHSRFVYEGSGDFINTLITPYGTNTFIRGEVGTTRWLETIYADGSRDRVEFNQSTNLGVAFSDPANTVPQGMNTGNMYLWFRNTYYWSRSACASSYGDYSKAKLYHWLHTADVNKCSGILESTKEALEGRVWYDYAGQGSPIFDGANNRPAHVGRVLDDGTTQLYTYGYNGFGNLTNTIDPLGRTFSYIYDTNGVDLLEVRMTRAGKNELLSKATYNAQHLPLTTTDAAGQTTTNTYNARGQLLTTSNPKGETTTYTYNTNGYLIAVNGPLPGTNDTVTATYDASGRMHSKTDNDGYTLVFNYDTLDRLTNIVFPDATTYEVAFNRLDVSAVQDRAGRQTTLEYDALRNLVKQTDSLGRATQFQWCNCGNIKSVTDPLGRTTEWRTDVQGRTIAKQYGDGSQISYFYENASGRLRQVVDEELQVKQVTHNRDNTLRSVSYLNAALPTAAVTYTYDPDYRRVTSMADGHGTSLYSYVPITGTPTLGAGRLAAIDGPYANDILTYTYDQLGRVISSAIDGIATARTYDASGRRVSETNALGTFTYGYDGSSARVRSETFPNGLTVTNSYGNNLQDWALASITHRVGPAAISQFNYTRDVPAGRVSAWSQQAGASAPDIYTFGYDNADRVLSAAVTNSGILTRVFAYTYDAADNRLTEVADTATNSATYNALNQLSTGSSSGTARTNQWDAENRLAVVISGNERTEFAYDGESRLTSIRLLTNGIEASLRRFVWCDYTICQERDSTGNTVTKRFFEQGVKIESGLNSGNYYFTRDHLGSVREILDGAGVVRARYSYDPYGRRTRLSGDLEADFGFAGMLRSEEAKLSLTWFRAYDAQSGRWLSRDPLERAELGEGPNLYAYAENNPVNVVDPLGLRGKKSSPKSAPKPNPRPAPTEPKQCCEKERDYLYDMEAVFAAQCNAAFSTYPEDCMNAYDTIKDPKKARAECVRLHDKADGVCNYYWDKVEAANALFHQCEAKGCKTGPVCEVHRHFL